MNLEDANTSPPPTEVGVGRHFDFPVVGLGASAGGVAALLRFFEELPSATGMAYVVILHLSPKHKSNADHVLQGATGMPVRQVNERTAIEPDHVYVVPPTHRLVVEDGHLSLGELPRAKGRHTAIDDFLRTLGQAQKDRAFAIILSGTGADGTVGIKTVKEQGGIILVQAPDDAEYESMPRNAIGTGLVDFVLPVAEMPQKLVQLWANAQAIKLPPLKDPDAAVDALRLGEEPLREILAELRLRTGHDFGQYKRATVLRRIERRLQVTQLQDLATYRDYLRDHPSETRLLLGDMLIGVTNFFRDRHAFETLERLVIPELFAGRGLEDTVRAWVPACATGEEAYSIAMLLAEAAEELAEPPQIMVFATDIDEDAITFARAARYPEPIVADVPPTRLRRFFTKDEGGGFRVNKTIREMVTFAVHNLLKDPPFSRIDLVSCRNFLIYLNRDAQHKALELLQFALVPNGYLMLGTSESVDDGTIGFTSVDKTSRIFRRLARPREALPPPLLGPAVVLAPAREGSMARVPTPRELHLEMLELYAPPSVVVDERGDIIHSSEHAHRFLQFTSGEPSLNLMKVVQPGLRAQLRSVLYQAMQTMQPAEAKAVRFVRARNGPPVDVRIHPLSDESKARRFALVIFTEHAEKEAPTTAVERAPDDAAAVHLEAQLQATRQQLQATVEQYETRNEELIASNEELSAINEELRSATEELETSREELQSINEELATVNQELKTSVEETNTINNDLQNLMAATEIAVLFVDTTLCLKRYTPAARALFNVIPSDLGRPLLDVTNQLDYPQLADDVQNVLDTLRTHATTVQSRSGAWFATRIVPYRTVEDRIRGAVLTFVDITQSRRTAHEAARNEAYVLRLLEGIEDHVVIALDKEARVTSWNRGAKQILGYSAAEAMGMPFEALFTPADREAGVPARDLESARASGRCAEQRWHLRKDGSMVFLTGALASIEADGLQGYAKIARDDTERYRLDERQQELFAAEVRVREQSDEQVRIKEEFLATMSHEMRNPLNAILLQTELVLGPSGMTTGDRAVRQAVVAIRQLASTQARLIDDLLDVSRQRTGKLELRSQLVPLPFIIGDAVGALAPEAVQKKITVVTDLPEEPLIVAADPLRVKQIAWNLLSNAIKFTPAGGRVTVRVTQDGDDARFDVEDTGEGIDSAVLPHVFDLFRQGDASLRRRHGGLGIGLALAKQLVEMQGGRIRADSPGIGQGAHFSVWLPLHIGQTPEAAPRDEPPPIDIGRRALANLSVLIVDDAPDTAFILREVLMRHGAAAQSHASAEAALASCRERPFDVILTDLAMPGTDGLAFIAQVRATTRNTATPVIVMSGYSRPEDIEKARAAGAADYIVKPVRIDAVIASILHAVDMATDPSADD